MTVARPSLLASAALSGVVFIGISGAGCSIAFELDREQCATTSDCSAQGFENAECRDQICVEVQGQGGGGAGGGGDGGQGGSEPPLPANFACLEDFEPPELPEMIHHRYLFQNVIGGAPPPADATVKFCLPLDVECVEPTQTLTPDETGLLEFDLPSSFKGYMELVTPDQPEPADDVMPTLIFFQEPSVIPPGDKLIQFISPSAINAIATSADVPLDPSRGTSILLIHDCAETRSSGVRFESSSGDDETTPFHFKGNLPDPDAVETDAQGSGGYVNMPVGNFSVTAHIAESGRFIGATSFLSRAGYLTYVPMGPTVE